MHIPMGDRIDALCQRQCAFALYCLPGESQPVFSMAEDGRTQEDFIFLNGFLLATFDGSTRFIPAELQEVPLPDAWEEMSMPPADAATTREQYAGLFSLYTDFIHSGGPQDCAGPHG